MLYRVHGHTTITVTVEVKADSEEEALEAAREQLPGLNSYSGNGGADNLVGVEGEGESISADGDIDYVGAELLEDEDQAEAERIVMDRWKAGQYILDSDNFGGVEVTAIPIKD